MFTRLDHVGIVCADLEKTIDFYLETFGFELCHTEVNEEQGHREAMLRVNRTDDGGATYLQLLTPTRPDSVVGRWLATRGEGLHHVAFGTPDVAGAAGALGGQGLRVLFDPPRRGSMGSRVTFLHPKDCHGVLTEIVTH
ncbi:methylmalonyl-CoA epimerase [Micromonospora sp. C31]|uniref:methylmalonyl-CoA epimerase n=1 Tax=Micromonospora sp. C31 TaxID=2824876 RepID=UPI001B367D75|nr:methylmalonyl-CoA epimerase [Micromonospora sp. C31]MBQ1075631.1 methylmalonyl-CoA epimerase [Micromonospora sp. C31]